MSSSPLPRHTHSITHTVCQTHNPCVLDHLLHDSISHAGSGHTFLPHTQPSSCHTFPSLNHLPVTPYPHSTIFLSHLTHTQPSPLSSSSLLCTALQLSARLNRELCSVCVLEGRGETGRFGLDNPVFSICFFVSSFTHILAALCRSRNRFGLDAVFFSSFLSFVIISFSDLDVTRLRTKSDTIYTSR